MDLALVLCDDIEALGVEYFFELARTVCDLSPTRFEQFYNEFRSRSTLDASEFSELITTYLSEQNMMDLMNRAAEIHNKALKTSSLSTQWIDFIESIFDELDFGATFHFTWNEVAILSVILARGQIDSWATAKQNAIQLLEYCNRTGASPRLTKRSLKNAMKTLSASEELLSEIENSVRVITERWSAVFFGDLTLAQLAAGKSVSAYGHHLSLRLKNGLKEFLEKFFCGRLYTVPEPRMETYASSMFRSSLMMFQRFSQDYQYSAEYLNLEQLLRDPVYSCISNALVNYECICNEIVLAVNSMYSHQNDSIRMFVDDISSLDGIVNQAHFEIV